MLVASYVFYGAWDYRFLFLILLSTVIDFIGGLGVAGVELPARKRRNLGVLLIGGRSICSPPGSLRPLFAGDVAAALPLHRATGRSRSRRVCDRGVRGFLPRLYRLPTEQRRKVFLVISMVAEPRDPRLLQVLRLLHRQRDPPVDTFGVGRLSWMTLRIILPAGISFYTFQAMSYTIDIYRGEAEPTDDFADFALFVASFPTWSPAQSSAAHTLLPRSCRTGAIRAAPPPCARG